MSDIPIGKVAKITGVKVTTIRFYEQIGLLQIPKRTASERRVYSADAVSRLAFIRHARDLGFSVDAVRDLLDLSDHPDRACDGANSIARDQLRAVEAKIVQLKALRTELARMVSGSCDGPVSACRVIESLGGNGSRFRG